MFPVSSESLPILQNPFVPIHVNGQAKHEFEARILQVLALGRAASIQESAIASSLEATLEEPTVTEWAEGLSSYFGIHWERLRSSQELLFSLRQ